MNFSLYGASGISIIREDLRAHKTFGIRVKYHRMVQANFPEDSSISLYGMVSSAFANLRRGTQLALSARLEELGSAS